MGDLPSDRLARIPSRLRALVVDAGSAHPILAFGLSLLLVVLFLSAVILPDHRGDGTYYTVSRLLLQSGLGLRVYDNARMRAEVEAATQGRVSDIFRPNPPTAALIALPVAWLPPDSARRLWAAINAALLLASLALVLRTLLIDRPDPRNPGGMGRPATLNSEVVKGLAPPGERSSAWDKKHLFAFLACLAFGLFAAPVVEGMQLGQAYVLLLGLYSLAWWGLRARRSAVVGFCLALALMLKTSGAPLWLLLAARREWRALGWAFVGCLLLFGLSLPWLGLDIWRAYLADVLPEAAATPSVVVPAFQGLAGFWAHLFRADSNWNPAPLADLPGLAVFLSLLSSAAVLALTLVRGRGPAIDPAFGAAAVASVVLVPFAEQHHYTLLVLPVCLALASWRRNLSWPAAAALVVSGLLVGVPLPYEAPRLAAGGWALLAYPRLYGGLLLWGLLLSRAGPPGRLPENDSAG